MAEEGRRQAAEAALKALQERLAQQTEQIIALQAAARCGIEAERRLVESQL